MNPAPPQAAKSRVAHRRHHEQHHAQPARGQPPTAHRAHTGSRPDSTLADTTTTISPAATSFTRRRRPRCSSQSRRSVPKTGDRRSHACSRGLDRAKHQLASSTHGVVGSPGSSAPRYASPTQPTPAVRYSPRRRPVAAAGGFAPGGPSATIESF